jgi:hypothetical protein
MLTGSSTGVGTDVGLLAIATLAISILSAWLYPNVVI